MFLTSKIYLKVFRIHHINMLLNTRENEERDSGNWLQTSCDFLHCHREASTIMFNVNSFSLFLPGRGYQQRYLVISSLLVSQLYSSQISYISIDSYGEMMFDLCDFKLCWLF
jgi:hypothetical protein